MLEYVTTLRLRSPFCTVEVRVTGKGWLRAATGRPSQTEAWKKRVSPAQKKKKKNAGVHGSHSTGTERNRPRKEVPGETQARRVNTVVKERGR